MITFWSLKDKSVERIRYPETLWTAKLNKSRNCMLTVTTSQQVKIWDLKGNLLLTLPTSNVMVARLNKAGDHVLTLSYDGGAILWKIDLSTFNLSVKGF